MGFVYPPLDGSLNLAQALDFHIVQQNNTPAFSWGAADGTLTSISHFEFARAAHRVAHLLRPNRAGDVDGEVVAIVAVADTLVYQTLLAGCLVAGLVPFPISHRNSDPALHHLLTKTTAHRVLTHQRNELSTQTTPYLLVAEEIPTLAQMYPRLGQETSADAFTSYPLPAKAAALDDVALYLHSSGSTGLPKPIPMSHHAALSIAGQDLLTELRILTPRLAVGPLPAFHAMGFFTQFLTPVFNGVVACIYPPAGLASPEKYHAPVAVNPVNALEETKRAQSNGILIVPIFLMRWSQTPADVEYLKSLDFVSYSGGPLAQRVGDFLYKQGVKLVSIYGGTEFGGGNTYHKPLYSPDWSWVEFSPKVNVRWVPAGEDTFECQFLTGGSYYPAIENLPDTRGYTTQDLFERHPTKPHLYRIIGRADDVITLSNGEKVVPGPQEDILSTSPLIAGLVLFGRGRDRLGLLIEPSAAAEAVDPADAASLGKFRNAVWGTVAEANAVAPAWGRVYKEMILVTGAGKPMARAPKGTVVKKATERLYEAEIAALYETVEASGGPDGEVAPPGAWSVTELGPWLLSQAEAVSGRKLKPDADLFDQGFDSLHATFLRLRIVSALRAVSGAGPALATQVTQNFVYDHPSVAQLALAVAAVVDGTAGREDKKAVVERFVEKYAAGLDAPITRVRAGGISVGAVVLLTGSTGGLGSHILEALLRNEQVARVYAFNRPGIKGVADRQKAAFADRGLSEEVLSSSKLEYLEGDATQADLGISSGVFSELKNSLTVIIHNAWTLDFNKSVASFAAHLQATRNLIDLGRATDARFVFTSSIAAAQAWDAGRGPVPEDVLPAENALGTGYGESKHVAERVIAAAGLRATSLRIGQISGAKNGAWATADWVPALVKSGIALAALPAAPNSAVAWLPPSAVAQTVLDVALQAGEGERPAVLNVVHPRPAPWDTVFGALAEAAGVPLVPIEEWLDRVEREGKNADAEMLARIPAIKLLGFLKAAVGGTGAVQFTTAHAEEISPALSKVPILGPEEARRWLGYWKSVGFI
ncbi:Acetyl-CoA synthetase-like protein [Mycena indigotica]|uniref:Acetyl-CoA synthetase-like protein n=1 Tax=Mycena indigotica TaxID=2126181 RepID=A0A8H6S4R9_9AGAR|nr:Acetyl-CoA synthetase-like protein [Mycena indigotica]KAF7291295.1 Acetyl-CoA synthetase-like protein [Mycena indigotica]